MGEIYTIGDDFSKPDGVGLPRDGWLSRGWEGGNRIPGLGAGRHPTPGDRGEDVDQAAEPAWLKRVPVKTIRGLRF